MSKHAAHLPVLDSPLQRAPAIAPVPKAIDCLRCQLLGRRRLMCSKADACAEMPHVFAVGPVLLGLWAATTIAFIVAIW